MNVDFPEENHRLFFSLQFSVFIYSAKLSRRNGKMISSPTGPLTCFLAGRRGHGAERWLLCTRSPHPSTLRRAHFPGSPVDGTRVAMLSVSAAPHLASSATGSARIGAPLRKGGFFTQKQDRRSGPVRLSGMMLPNQSLYAFAAIAYSYSAQTAFCAAVLFAYASEPSRRSI